MDKATACPYQRFIDSVSMTYDAAHPTAYTKDGYLIADLTCRCGYLRWGDATACKGCGAVVAAQ